MEPAGPALARLRAARDSVFELTGVVPLAGFAVLHLASYARVLFGATELGARRPLAVWGMGFELLGALLFGCHVALAGPVWLARRRAEAGRPRSAALALHRLTGAILLPFVVDHFVRFRWPILRGDRYPAESVLALARELSSTVAGVPLVAAWHVLGTLALSYHLSYGLSRFAERHAPPAGVRKARVVAAAIGVLAAVFGTLTIVRLATG